MENGNIEHAWNHDYIRLNDQGLNRIELDGGKQWNKGWEVDRDYGWSMDEEQMTMDEYGWKLVQNGWSMDEKRLEKCMDMNNEWMKNGIEDVQKNHVKDFGPPSTKNRTWEPNLEWQVLFNYFGRKTIENQLCAKTHSMFRVPDLFWLTGAVFRNMSVTHSKFSKVQILGVFARYVSFATFRIPRRFPKGHSMFRSATLYIYNNNNYPTYLMSSQPYRFADRLEDVERGWEMLEASPFLVGYSPPQHRRHSAPVSSDVVLRRAASSHFQRRSAQRSSCARVVFMVHEDVATRKSMCL